MKGKSAFCVFDKSFDARGELPLLYNTFEDEIRSHAAMDVGAVEYGQHVGVGIDDCFQLGAGEDERKKDGFYALVGTRLRKTAI